MLPKPPGPVDRSNLDSLKAHYTFTDELCKFNFKITVLLALCCFPVLYMTKDYGDIPELEIPLKLLIVLMPLATFILIAIQSYIMYMRQSFKRHIDQFPSK